MSRSEGNPKTEKKLLENPFVGSLVVPIAIVLVGALIIFGVTTMLSTDRSYKDLVREMQSKTFGNRWIAAYELSKLIATSSVPAEELPWLVTQLSSVYNESPDPRTREFLIVALGALKHPMVVPTLEKGLSDEAPLVRFHALVSIGNLQAPSLVNWELVKPFLDAEDHGLRHAALLALAHHRVDGAEEILERKLDDDVAGVRYAAALALIGYKNEKAVPQLTDILLNQGGVDTALDEEQLIQLQINILEHIEREQWKLLSGVLSEVLSLKANPRLTTKTQEVLNLLKN